MEQREKLTGNKDADMLLLMKLSDRDLGSVCRVNQLARRYYNDPVFWRNRLLNRYNIPGEEARRFAEYLGFDSFKDFYVYFSKLELPQTALAILRDRNTDIQVTDLMNRVQLPKWIDRREYLFELRRRYVDFPLFGATLTIPSFTPNLQFYDHVLPQNLYEIFVQEFREKRQREEEMLLQRTIRNPNI